MDRQHTMQILIERETRKRDDALAAWRDAQRAAENASQQADSLVQYREEYRNRWSAQFAKSAPIEIVRCYHGFVQRLDQAITTQQATARQTADRVAAALKVLRHREMKLATVRRLIERRQQAALQVAQRREQKTFDEAAQRLGWAARGGLAAN